MLYSHSSTTTNNINQSSSMNRRLLIIVLMACLLPPVSYTHLTSVIDAVYILASYTYGPILGLFAFGIFMKQQGADCECPLYKRWKFG